MPILRRSTHGDIFEYRDAAGLPKVDEIEIACSVSMYREVVIRLAQAAYRKRTEKMKEKRLQKVM